MWLLTTLANKSQLVVHEIRFIFLKVQLLIVDVATVRTTANNPAVRATLLRQFRAFLVGDVTMIGWISDARGRE